MSDTTKTPLLSNRTYDIAKDAVTIYLPAAVTLYAGLAVLWEWVNTDKVVASAGLIITFLGIVLKISTKQYDKSDFKFDGSIVVNESALDQGLYPIHIDATADLEGRKEVVLRVDNAPNG